MKRKHLDESEHLRTMVYQNVFAQVPGVPQGREPKADDVKLLPDDIEGKVQIMRPKRQGKLMRAAEMQAKVTSRDAYQKIPKTSHREFLLADSSRRTAWQLRELKLAVESLEAKIDLLLGKKKKRRR